MSGHGVLTTAENHYVGEWLRGLRHGRGVEKVAFFAIYCWTWTALTTCVAGQTRDARRRLGRGGATRPLHTDRDPILPPCIPCRVHVRPQRRRRCCRDARQNSAERPHVPRRVVARRNYSHTPRHCRLRVPNRRPRFGRSRRYPLLFCGQHFERSTNVHIQAAGAS